MVFIIDDITLEDLQETRETQKLLTNVRQILFQARLERQSSMLRPIIGLTLWNALQNCTPIFLRFYFQVAYVKTNLP